MPTGKVLGGSSMLNFMLYVRGHRRDYDEWERLGNPGWGYDEVLRYFKKSEGYVGEVNGKEKFHGEQGPLKVQGQDFIYPMGEVNREALEEMGYQEGDINGELQVLD